MWIYTKKRLLNLDLIESIFIEYQCGVHSLVALQAESGTEYILFHSKDRDIAEEMLKRIRYAVTTNKHLFDVEQANDEIKLLAEKQKGSINNDDNRIFSPGTHS